MENVVCKYGGPTRTTLYEDVGPGRLEPDAQAAVTVAARIGEAYVNLAFKAPLKFRLDTQNGVPVIVLEINDGRGHEVTVTVLA